jgi:hypothetical protein
MGLRSGIGLVIIVLAAIVGVGGTPVHAARKPANTSGPPTGIFLLQAQIHIFLVTTPVKQTYSSYRAFSSSVCGKSGFSKSAWKSGAMERMQSFNSENQLSICGATYASARAAHQAYIMALTNIKTGFQSETMARTVVGHESARAYGMSKTLRLPVNEIFFRHGSTLVRVMVIGRRAISANLLNVARTVNKGLMSK